MQKQIDLQGMQFGKKTDQVLKAAAEPIDAPSHDQIELPLGGVATQAIEFRAAVPALSAAYAMVPIDANDLAAHAGSDLAQFALLVGRGLLGGRYPKMKIENGALHRKASPVLLPERDGKFGVQNGAFCWPFGNTISRGFFVHPGVARCETRPSTALNSEGRFYKGPIFAAVRRC